MNSMMWKTTLREIRHSLGRYLAILAIVALGVGIFAGLKVTKPFMVSTIEGYFEEYQLYDFQLISTYGFEQKDVEYLAAKEGARAVEGSYSYDVLCSVGEDDSVLVLKAHTLLEKINGVEVLAGRLPENPDECIVDADLYGEEMIADGSEGLNSLMLSNAMLLSAWTGKTVALPMDEAGDAAFEALLVGHASRSKERNVKPFTLDVGASFKK